MLAHHVLEMPLNGPDDNALLELAVFMQMKRFLHNQARATTTLPHHCATTARHGRPRSDSLKYYACTALRLSPIAGGESAGAQGVAG